MHQFHQEGLKVVGRGLQGTDSARVNQLLWLALCVACAGS